jgi:hypothetical protein
VFEPANTIANEHVIKCDDHNGNFFSTDND